MCGGLQRMGHTHAAERVLGGSEQQKSIVPHSAGRRSRTRCGQGWLPRGLRQGLLMSPPAARDSR